MALRGTIDGFPIADVARLLARTGQSGTLLLSGDRGSTRLDVVNGSFGGGCTSSGLVATDASDVLFDMLQFEHGEFAFDATTEQAPSAAPHSTDRRDGRFLIRPADEVLAEVEGSLDAWSAISASVGSLDRRVELVEELPGEDVVIDAASWRVVRAVGSSATVRDAARVLSAGDLSIARSIAALLERRLLVLGDEAVSSETVPLSCDARPTVEMSTELDDPRFEVTAGASHLVGLPAEQHPPLADEPGMQSIQPEAPPALPHRQPVSAQGSNRRRGGELDYDPWSDPSIPDDVAARLAGSFTRPPSGDIAEHSEMPAWDGGEPGSAVEEEQEVSEWAVPGFDDEPPGAPMPWSEPAVYERATVHQPDQVLSDESWSEGESIGGSADDLWFGVPPSFEEDGAAPGSGRPKPIFTSEAFLPSPIEGLGQQHEEGSKSAEWASATFDADVGLWWDAAVPDAEDMDR